MAENTTTEEKGRKRDEIMAALRQKILPLYAPLLIEFVKLPTEVCPTVTDYLVSDGQIAQVYEEDKDFSGAIQQHILHAHFLSSAWVNDFLKGSNAEISDDDQTDDLSDDSSIVKSQQKRQRMEPVAKPTNEMIKEFVISGFTAYLGYSYGYNAVHIDDEKAERYLEMVENFGYHLDAPVMTSHPLLRLILGAYGGGSREELLQLGHAKMQYNYAGGKYFRLLTLVSDAEKLDLLRSSTKQGYNAAAYELFNFTDGKEGLNTLLAMKPGAHSRQQQEPYYFLWNHFHKKFLNASNSPKVLKTDNALEALGVRAFNYLRESVKRTMDTDDIDPLQALYVHCQLSIHERRAAPKLATMDTFTDFLEDLAKDFPPLHQLHKYSSGAGHLPKAIIECAKILYEIYCGNGSIETIEHFPADYWYSYLCAAHCKPVLKHLKHSNE